MENFKPMLYSSEMVKGILEDRKKQTRRIIKPQPLLQGRPDERISLYNRRNNLWEVKDKLSTDGFSILDSFKCKYSIDDIIWVRETTCFVMSSHTDLLEGMSSQTVYKASVHPDWMEYAKEKYGYKWIPSIHMPKQACRIFLKVKNIRIERLCNISDNDTIAEGVIILGPDPMNPLAHLFGILGYGFFSPFDAFKFLWIKINGIQSWESNPWTWVIEFERINLTDKQMNEFLYGQEAFKHYQ